MRQKVRKLAKVVRPIRKARVRSTNYKFDHFRPQKITVYVCRNRRHMFAEAHRRGVNINALGPGCCGFVQRFTSITNRRPVTYRGIVVARMFLCADQVRRRPNELIAHECVHAGMSWATYQKANVTKSMENEEIMAYAAGRLNNLIVGFGWSIGVYDGRF